MKRLGLLACTLLSGCLSPSPAVVLHTLRPQAAPAAAAAAPLALEVLPVRIPDLLQRPELVLVQGPDRLSISDVHRWGNALDRDIQRVVLQDLSALLGSDVVVPYPEGPQVKARLRLQLDVARLEGQLGGKVTLEATWTLIEAESGNAIVRRRALLEEPVGGADAEALVAAHSRALGALTQQISAALREQR